MNTTEQLAAATVVVLNAALAHLQRANLQTSINEARADIAKAVLDLRQLLELAHVALPDIPRPSLQ
jgi:hypothetical protein